jgi:hypothetical protein
LKSRWLLQIEKEIHLAKKHESLKYYFNEYNSRYFGGRLPRDTKVVWGELADINAIGVYNEGRKIFVRRVRGINKGKLRLAYSVRDEIIIDWRLKSIFRIAMSTLLHEMAHQKLRNKDRGDGHGHIFQREMKRLAKLGAFHYLW